MHMSSDSVAAPVAFAALRRSEFSVHRYRVWGPGRQYIDVDAGTAGEAVRAAGLEKPLRAERLYVRLPVILDGDALEYAYQDGASAAARLSS